MLSNNKTYVARWGCNYFMESDGYSCCEKSSLMKFTDDLEKATRQLFNIYNDSYYNWLSNYKSEVLKSCKNIYNNPIFKGEQQIADLDKKYQSSLSRLLN